MGKLGQLGLTEDSLLEWNKTSVVSMPTSDRFRGRAKFKIDFTGKISFGNVSLSVNLKSALFIFLVLHFLVGQKTLNYIAFTHVSF